jgi:mycothiol synthase
MAKGSLKNMLTIRPFDNSDSDYEALLVIEKTVWPDYPYTLDELKHNDATRDPKYLFRRFVGEVDGEIIATCLYCEPWWAIKPGKYYIDLEVLPTYRRQGIGAACYRHVMDLLAEHDPVIIAASTREDHPGAVDFLTKRGFRQVLRSPMSELDVANFDFAPFSEYASRMRELAIQIFSLEEMGAVDPDWKRKFYELETEISRDVPSTDPLTPPTYENFQERVLRHPAFNAACQFIALDGDTWVGLSGLWLSLAEPGKLYTGLTGVVRSHRRKGIATAMKLRAITFAESYGAEVIETDNEENNPMYELNLKLGFEPRPAWLQFEKQIP